MGGNLASLSEREKEVLRLLLRGHDAKSIARSLNLSVHTVNEYLRQSRRKLEVSSSREAARLLGEAEQEPPKFFADKKLGVGGGLVPVAKNAMRNGVAAADRSAVWFVGGMLTMFLLVAAAAVAAFHTGSEPTAGAPPTVVETSPKPGATIMPGRVFVSVTYDRPMMAGSASFAGPADLAPQTCGTPEQSKDGRTYRMCYIAAPGHAYEIWFNREPYMHFQSTEGIPAKPYRLAFRVNGKLAAAADEAQSAAPDVSAARSWVELLDKSRWSESWRLAGDAFKSHVSEAQWASSVQPAREPFGAVTSRTLKDVKKMTSLPGLPDGEYESLQFQTDFANKKGAVETLGLAHEQSGWKVIGYFIR